MSWLRPLELPAERPKPKRIYEIRSMPVYINGKKYKSVRQASEKLGITWRQIYRMLDKGEARDLRMK